jgi:glycosyltransferase involved in cell wall biosynthesis
MLKDKGLKEFVEAAKLVKNFVSDWRFVLAGAADCENPTAVSKLQLEQWRREGYVDWVDFVVDMTPLYKEAAIVCLPSYREGMPKALLEAAAAGCAVVTTDTVGCREAIVNGRTGDLVPVGDSRALAATLVALIIDTQRRNTYGVEGHARAIKEYSLKAIIGRFLVIYRELLFNAK